MRMKEEKTFRKILEDNNSKVTKPRLVVFNLLLNQPPQSIAELVSSSAGRVNRVSVYRIIDHFEKVGIARRVTIGWKYKIELSDIFLYHHHHITCLSCGRIEAIKSGPAAEETINSLALHTGFTVSTHQLELQGYCHDCQKS